MGKMRTITVRQGFGQERNVCSREAVSLKQALLDFYNETLKQYGYKDPKVVGNVLTVRYKRDEKTYIATEAK